jgi:hypothetical protein
LAIFTSVRQTTRESAETIATGLRTIFTRIQRGKTIEQLREFGIELTDLEGKFVGPYEAVKRLSEGLRLIDPRDIRFSAIVEELGGFRQIGKVIPLIQQFAVAQEALKVAQKGQGSLTEAQVIAQKSLANQIAKVREQFLNLIADVGKSKAFQSLFQIVTSLASGLISLAGAMKPILPILAIIGAVKGVKALGDFGAGFFGAMGKGGGARGTGESLGSSLSGSKDKDKNETTSRAIDATKANTSALNTLTDAVRALTAKVGSTGSTTLNSGGKVMAFARGGVVPGSGNRDTVPAMLMPGEFVIRKKAVETIGADRLHNINKHGNGGSIRQGKSNNRSKFAKGGAAKLASIDGDFRVVDGDTFDAKVTPTTDPFIARFRVAEFDAYESRGASLVSSDRAKKIMSLNPRRKPLEEVSGRYKVPKDYIVTKKEQYTAQEAGFAAKDELENKIASFIGQKAAKQTTPGLGGVGRYLAKTGFKLRDDLTTGRKWDEDGNELNKGGFVQKFAEGGEADIHTIKTRKQLQQYLYGAKSESPDTLVGSNVRIGGRLLAQAMKTNNEISEFNPIGDEGEYIQLDPSGSGKVIKDFLYYARGGLVQKFAEGGKVQRNLGYIDYDVIANEANSAVVEEGMKKTGAKGPRVYADYLTDLAVKARKNNSINRLRAIYGVAGSGKTTLARGQGTDKATLRETNRFPILSPDDIEKANEILILTSSISRSKMEDFLKDVDRAYTLSSTTAQEKERIKAQRTSRDITGIGLEGRKPGVTSGVSTDTAVGEALLEDALGSKSVVLGRTESGGLRRKRGNELVDILKKKIAFTWGGFAPTTAGHESIMDAAAAMGFSPDEFIALVGSNEGVKAGDPSSYRTAVFDQDFRVLLAKAGFGARGATVLPKPRDFEVPQGFDVTQGEGRRRVLLPGAGSMAFVADKTAEQTAKYREAGYGVANIERTGGISGTMVRDLIMAGDMAKLQEVLSPNVYEIISNNIGKLRNRANVLPSIIEQVRANQGSSLEALDKQIESIGIKRIDSKRLASDPEYAAQAQLLENLREEKRKIQARASIEPYRILSELAKSQPDKYALDTTATPKPVTATPLSQMPQIAKPINNAGRVGELAIQKGKSIPEILEEEILSLGRIKGIKEILGTNDRTLDSVLRISNIKGGKNIEQAIAIVNRALAKAGTASAAEEQRIAGLTKVGVVGLLDGAGNLDYSKNFEWDLNSGNTVYAYVRGFRGRYLEAVQKMQAQTAAAASELAENVQYTDIFTGDRLAFDFDKTLIDGADILGSNGLPDLARYSDRSAVENALRGSRPTKLALKLKSLIDADPEFVKQTRVLTARPQNTADLLASALQKFGLPYKTSDITGVGGLGTNIATAKATNLGQLEKLIDDNLENIRAAQTAGKKAFLYTEPKAKPELDLVMGQGNIEGSVVEKALALLGANLPPIDQLEQNRAIDFPGGLGRAAQFFDIDPNIPTEVKRTLDGSSFERAREEFARFYNETAVRLASGGQASEYEDRGLGGLAGLINGLYGAPGSIERQFQGAGVYEGHDPEKILGLPFGLHKPLIHKKEKVFGKIGLRNEGNQITATYFANKERTGFVSAKKAGGDLYTIGLSKATKGYGPRLYDVVMEAATAAGGMLTSDRNQVSDAAQAVWKFYFKNRGDVKKTPLPPEQWTKNSQYVSPKLYGKKETWPPPTDDAWILQSGYSKSPDLINSGDVIDMNDPKYAQFVQQQQMSFMARHNGGSIRKFAKGGTAEDTVPALLTPGEFVINKKAAQKIGYGQLHKLNKADKLQGYNKGGYVGYQRFFKGGQAEKDVERAQGYQLTDIKEAEKVFAFTVAQLGPEIRDKILSTLDVIEAVKAGETTSFGTAFTEGTRGQAAFGKRKGKDSTMMAFQIGGEKVAATTETVAHETGHLADYALGGNKGMASQTEGTFQFDLVEKVKPVMIKAFEQAGMSAKRIAEYQASNEELFAEFFAKASPQVRAIITSTTDSAVGMKLLADNLGDAGYTYAGLEASDIDPSEAKPATPKPATPKQTLGSRIAGGANQAITSISSKIASIFTKNKPTPTTPPSVPPSAPPSGSPPIIPPAGPPVTPPVGPSTGGATPAPPPSALTNDAANEYLEIKAKQLGMSLEELSKSLVYAAKKTAKDIQEKAATGKIELKVGAMEAGAEWKVAGTGAEGEANQKAIIDRLSAQIRAASPKTSETQSRDLAKQIAEGMAAPGATWEGLLTSITDLNGIMSSDISTQEALTEALKQEAKERGINADIANQVLGERVQGNRDNGFSRFVDYIGGPLKATTRSMLLASSLIESGAKLFFSGTETFAGTAATTLAAGLRGGAEGAAVAAELDISKQATDFGKFLEGFGGRLGTGGQLLQKFAGGLQAGAIAFFAISGAIKSAANAFNQAKLESSLKKASMAADTTAEAFKRFEKAPTQANAILAQQALANEAKTAESLRSTGAIDVQGRRTLDTMRAYDITGITSAVSGEAQEKEARKAYLEGSARRFEQAGKLGENRLQQINPAAIAESASIVDAENAIIDKLARDLKDLEAAPTKDTAAIAAKNKQIQDAQNDKADKLFRKSQRFGQVASVEGETEALRQFYINQATSPEERETRLRRLQGQEGGTADERKKNQEAAFAEAKRLAAMEAEAEIKTRLLADATHALTLQTENLLRTYSVATAMLQRFGDSIGLIKDSANATAAALEGQAQIGNIDRTNENILGNIDAYSIEEVRAAAVQTGQLAGGGAAGETLQNQVLTAKVLRESLPQALATTGSEDVDDVINKLEDSFQQAGVAFSDPMKEQLRESLRSQVAGRQGVSFDKLAGESDVVANTLKQTEAGLKAAQEFQKRYNDALSVAVELQNSYAKALSQSIDYQIKASEIRSNAQIQLKEALGQRVTSQERNDAADLRIRALTSTNIIPGGTTDPDKILEQLLSGTAAQQSQKEELDRRNQAMAAASTPEDREKSKAAVAEQMNIMAKQNVAINNNRKALEEMANNTEAASNALKDLQELDRVSTGATNFARKALTSSGDDLMKMNQQLQAFTKFRSGRATDAEVNSLEFRQNVFEGGDMIKSVLPKEIAEQMDAKTSLEMLRRSPGGQEALNAQVAVGPKGEAITLEQALNMKAGGIDPVQQQYIDAYSAATERQAKAADNLALASQAVAETFNNKMLEVLGQIQQQLPTILEQAVTAGMAPAVKGAYQEMSGAVKQRQALDAAQASSMGLTGSNFSSLSSAYDETVKADSRLATLEKSKAKEAGFGEDIAAFKASGDYTTFTNSPEYKNALAAQAQAQQNFTNISATTGMASRDQAMEAMRTYRESPEYKTAIQNIKDKEQALAAAQAGPQPEKPAQTVPTMEMTPATVDEQKRQEQANAQDMSSILYSGAGIGTATGGAALAARKFGRTGLIKDAMQLVRGGGAGTAGAAANPFAAMGGTMGQAAQKTTAAAAKPTGLLGRVFSFGDEAVKGGAGLLPKAGAAANVGGKLLGKAVPFLGAALGAFSGITDTSQEAQKRGVVERGVLGALTGDASTGSMFSGALGIEKGSAGDQALGIAGATATGALTGAAVGSVVPVVGTAIGAAVGAVLGGGAEIYKVLTAEDSPLAAWASSLGSAMLDAVTSAGGAFIDFTLSAGSTIGTFISESFAGMWNFVTSGIEGVGSFLYDSASAAGGVIRDTFTSVFGEFGGWIYDAATAPLALFADIGQKAYDFIKDHFSGIFSTISDAISGIWSWITGKRQEAKDASSAREKKKQEAAVIQETKKPEAKTEKTKPVNQMTYAGMGPALPSVQTPGRPTTQAQFQQSPQTDKIAIFDEMKASNDALLAARSKVQLGVGTIGGTPEDIKAYEDAMERYKTAQASVKAISQVTPQSQVATNVTPTPKTQTTSFSQIAANGIIAQGQAPAIPAPPAPGSNKIGPAIRQQAVAMEPRPELALRNAANQRAATALAKPTVKTEEIKLDTDTQKVIDASKQEKQAKVNKLTKQVEVAKKNLAVNKAAGSSGVKSQAFLDKKQQELASAQEDLNMAYEGEALALEEARKVKQTEADLSGKKVQYTVREQTRPQTSTEEKQKQLSPYEQQQKARKDAYEADKKAKRDAYMQRTQPYRDAQAQASAAARERNKAAADKRIATRQQEMAVAQSQFGEGPDLSNAQTLDQLFGPDTSITDTATVQSDVLAQTEANAVKLDETKELIKQAIAGGTPAANPIATPETTGLRYDDAQYMAQQQQLIAQRQTGPVPTALPPTQTAQYASQVVSADQAATNQNMTAQSYTLSLDAASLKAFTDIQSSFTAFGSYVTQLAQIKLPEKIEIAGNAKYTMDINITGAAAWESLEEKTREMATKLIAGKITDLERKLHVVFPSEFKSPDVKKSNASSSGNQSANS